MITKQTWPALSAVRKKDKINTNPDYQRPAVWTKAQKQRLIDSMLRGYDIPKIYLNCLEDDNYDVVDGQQRFRAIWDFFDNQYPLAKDNDPVDNHDVSNKYYKDLPKDIIDNLESYNLDIAFINNTSEDEIKEMFLRLQNGTSLKSQEKRNAYPGKMRDFIKELTSHKIFSSVSFKNERYAHDLVAAQMTLQAINGDVCDVKDRSLNNMYEEYKDFSNNSKESKIIYNTLDYLSNCFPEKSPELNKTNTVSLFVLILELNKSYVLKGMEKNIANWFIDFEASRKLEAEKPEDEQSPRMAIYQSKTRNATDSLDSLKYRHEFLKESLLNAVPDLQPKDSRRIFNADQRQVIYRRDKGICQICGKKCEWDAWEADHIIPWSKGGQTIVSNGQILCASCNSKKGSATQYEN